GHAADRHQRGRGASGTGRGLPVQATTYRQGRALPDAGRLGGRQPQKAGASPGSVRARGVLPSGGQARTGQVYVRRSVQTVPRQPVRGSGGRLPEENGQRSRKRGGSGSAAVSERDWPPGRTKQFPEGRRTGESVSGDVQGGAAGCRPRSGRTRFETGPHLFRQK